MSTARPRRHLFTPHQAKTAWRLHIRFSALLHMALANLRFKRFRSAITIIGIAIGTGSVFMLLSFGIGLQDLVSRQIMQGQSINTIDINASGSRVLKIDDATVKSIAAISHVDSASGFYANAGKLTIGGATADVVAYGVDRLYLDTANLVMGAGSLIDPSKSDEIVVSSAILDSLGVQDAKKTLGSTISLTVKQSDGVTIDKKLTIVGVVSSGNGQEVFVPARVYTDAGATTYAGAKAQATDRSAISAIRKKIEGFGYETTSPIDTLNQVDQVFRILRVILVGFGLIGMSIAILGMINTLTVSLLERTREVALMLALGARPRDMRQLFIIEAVALSLIGGIVGVAGALMVSIVIDAVLNQLAQSRGVGAHFTVFAMPLWLIAVTLAFMALVGYIVAFVPGRRAARINSIEALRRE